MEEAAIKLIEQWVVSFILVLLLLLIWYWMFKFWSAILSMLRRFLDWLLEEFRQMIKSITELGDAEKLARETHSKEHKYIIELVQAIHKEIKEK